MGASHIAAVYANWSHLPDPAFRMLVYMALVPKDETSRPTFWRGRDALAEMGLGRPADKAGQQAVKRALKVLLDAGAIERTLTGYRGKNSEYRIILTGPKGYAPRPPIETEDAGERGTPRVPERGTPGDPKGVRPTVQRGTPGDPPRNTRNTRSAAEEENSSTKVSTDRACEPDDQPEISHLDARRIVREFMDAGGVLDDLLADAPKGLTRSERTRYAAAKITEAAS